MLKIGVKKLFVQCLWIVEFYCFCMFYMKYLAKLVIVVCKFNVGFFESEFKST